MNALVIYNARLVDESMDAFGAVVCVEGKICALFLGNYAGKESVESVARSVLMENGFSSFDSLDFFDANGFMLSPAFIDMHVHFRDPGLTEKEDLHSGLRAAIAGGYGTVVAMPNTSPVISSAKDSRDVMCRAKKISLCNFYQSVSITKDFSGDDISHLEGLDHAEVPLITEDGFDVASSYVLFEAMKKAASKGIVVSCHCEDTSFAHAAKPHRKHALDLMKKHNVPPYGHDVDVSGVPADALEEMEAELSKANELLYSAENTATERNIGLARMADCHIHICHISTKEAVDAVRRAKTASANGKKGFCVTAEATPHHIALAGDDEPNIRFLVNPPLRSECDRLSIIDALQDGTIDCISTDHAPHTLDDKTNGAPGFTGLECAYSVCNTVLVKGGKMNAQDLSRLMSASPARILNLKKGVFKVGYDADFVLLAPDEKRVIETRDFYSKGKATPFDGKTYFGVVKATFVSGKKKAL